jgi:Mn-dependent DtxR family transcriptional regulator
MATVKQRILDLLREGTPMLSVEISDALKISKASASESTKELHLAGKIHVSDWRHSAKNGGNKVYAYGKGKDIPKSIRTAKIIDEPFTPHADVAAAWLRNPI